MKSPITHLLPEPAIKSYFLIFSVLLQVRHQRKMLSSVWKSLLSRSKASLLHHEDPIQLLLKKVSLMRSKAETILSDYESFVFNFCVQSSWNRFRRQLVAAQSFNKIYKFHHEYLDSILRMSFFGRIQTEEFRAVNEMLHIVTELKGLAALLDTDATEYLDLPVVEEQVTELRNRLVRNGKLVRDLIRRVIQNSEGTGPLRAPAT